MLMIGRISASHKSVITNNHNKIEFFTKNFWNFTKHSYLCSPKLEKGSQIEIWCNGSTTDSGSVSEGSSPSISTKNHGGIAQLVRAHDS